MRGVVRRSVLPKRVEIGEDPAGPVRDAVVNGRGAFPFAGARGFLTKDAGAQEIQQAIETVTMPQFLQTLPHRDRTDGFFIAKLVRA